MMKTIELTRGTTSVEELFQLAHGQNVLVRTPEGNLFVIAELEISDEEDDFADDVARTRQNSELLALLDERSRDTSRISAEEARRHLGLS
jgi:hypothetical protein